MPSTISRLAQASTPTLWQAWKSTSATTMTVPRVLSRCGGAAVSRSHLKCHDMSQVEPDHLQREGDQPQPVDRR